MHVLYVCLSYFFHIFSKFYLNIRILKNKEDPLRYKEKIGFYTIKNDKPVMWFHASSLGEIKSIIPIILHYESKIDDRILVTTTTLSSAKYCSDIFKNKSNIIHQFFPFDTPIVIERFLKHWKPKISVITESELWPNMIFKTKKISKLILLNARLSKKSFFKWKIIKSFAKKIFSQFDSIASQSRETKSFIEFFNINNIHFFGNLKFASLNDKPTKNIFNFEKKVNFSWIAMSTHSGEEEFVINTIKNLKKEKISSQCILIPRHINRIDKITYLIKANNLTYQLKSTDPIPLEDRDIYILNSYGDTKEVFEKINLVFLGGSIIAHGGQNPLEPAREGCFVFHGPYIYNFTEIYDFLSDNGISSLVTSDQSLAEQLISKFAKQADNEKFKETIQKYSQKILLDHINYLNSFI